MRHLIVVLGLLLHVNKCSLALLMRNLIVVLGLTLHVNRCSLASATGPFFSNGSSCLVQRERREGRLTRVYSTIELNPPSVFYTTDL